MPFCSLHASPVVRQIVYKRFPGNKKVIISLPSHFVIDLNLLGINNVHRALAGSEGGTLACARAGTAAGDCNCTRELLVQGMMDAITSRPKGPSMQTLQRHVLRQYQAVTKERLQNLPPGPERNSPVETAGAEPAVEESAAPGMQPQGTTYVVEEEPDNDKGGNPNPIMYHAGLSDEINKVLGSTTPAGRHVARNGPAATDAVVLRVCKHRVREDLVRCSLYLGPPNAAARESAFLYLPKGASERDLPGLQIQELFNLLTKLHRLFSDALDAFQIYYAPNDGVIAFNRGDRLWYNAAYDDARANPRARAEFWFLTICHELAHHYCPDNRHDSRFSDYACKITLEYSQSFYARF